jgi:hypothetical protein
MDSDTSAILWNQALMMRSLKFLIELLASDASPMAGSLKSALDGLIVLTEHRLNANPS